MQECETLEGKGKGKDKLDAAMSPRLECLEAHDDPVPAVAETVTPAGGREASTSAGASTTSSICDRRRLFDRIGEESLRKAKEHQQPPRSRAIGKGSNSKKTTNKRRLSDSTECERHKKQKIVEPKKQKIVEPKKRLKNPSTNTAIRILQEDFGLICDNGLCRMNELEFNSIDLLRTHLSSNGLGAAETWFQSNMEKVKVNGTTLYVPSTTRAAVLHDWIRYNVLPLELLALHNIREYEPLSMRQVKSTLSQLGIKAQMGAYNVPWIGETKTFTWIDLEQYLATQGVPSEFWRDELPYKAVSLQQRASLFVYFLDYQTFFVKPTTEVHTGDCQAAPAQLAQDMLVLARPPPPSPQPESRTNAGDQDLANTFEHNDIWDYDPNKNHESTLDHYLLDPVPPKRRYLGYKSVFQAPLRDLTQAETIGNNLNCCPFYETLGRPRSRNVAFSWVGDPFGFRKELGRAYFSAFDYKGTRVEVGAFIRLDGEKNAQGQVFKIVAAFQATKSFIGIWDALDGKLQEIQNRGKAYLDLVPLDRPKNGANLFLRAENEWDSKHVEGLPTDIFDVKGIEVAHDIHLEQVSGPCKSGKFKPSKFSGQPLIPYQQRLLEEKSAKALAMRFALKSWPKRMKAEFVVLYNTPRQCKMSRTITGCTPRQEFSIFDSDDSDEFDSYSQEPNYHTALSWEDEISKLGNLDSVKIPKEGPHPLITFDGGTLFADQEELEVSNLGKDYSAFESLYQSSLSSKFKEILEEARRNLKQSSVKSRIQDYYEIKETSLKTKGGACSRTLQEFSDYTRHKSKLQEAACKQVQDLNDRRDVVVIAPCGSGKSLIFLSSALRAGPGVNFVIEPFNAIIKSQQADLHSTSNYLSIEQLYNERESKGGKNRMRAQDRLQQLLNLFRSSDPPKTTFLFFTTPELINERLQQLTELAELDVLKNITIDEVDVISQAHSGYRSVYMELLPKLRKHCNGAKFAFLSGTISTRCLAELLPATLSTATSEQATRKPLLYLSDRVLPDCLSFSVERKSNDEQVARRIFDIISGHKEGKLYPKCLCYCWTPRSAETMARQLTKLLHPHGASAVPITAPARDLNPKGHDETVKAFTEGSNLPGKGQIAILCCTSVLQRGFHVHDIRFVFHSEVPQTLVHYIQETGRAGRDGHKSWCVLFYRAQNFSTVRRIVKYHDGFFSTDIKRSIDDDISKVAAYCTSRECRYSQLACAASIAFCKPSAQRCSNTAKCDNCSDREDHFTELRIKPVLEGLNVSRRLTFKSKGNSLANDLMYLLVETQVLKKNGCQLEQGPHYHHVMQQLQSARLCFYVKAKGELTGVANCQSNRNDTDNEQNIIVGGRVEDLDTKVSIPADGLLQRKDPLDDMLLPFVVRFDAERIRELTRGRGNVADLLSKKYPNLMVTPKQYSEACSFLNDLPGGHMGAFSKYASILREAEQAGETLDCNGLSQTLFNNGVGLYFHAELDHKAAGSKIRLLPPERAENRRIFRKFGSHRFLHVKVAINVEDGLVVKLLRNRIQLIGRDYAYLWCKAQKTPQVFILFAERGIGICKAEELTVEQVRDWCIPIKFNPQLTLGEELKRMKLVFSQTTPSFLLPRGSLEIIPDIISRTGRPMTDGCGLVSREAINMIWRDYKQLSDPCPSCPYTSFQGRIGGCKGLWVLDHSLVGIQIKCRASQEKFKLPMLALNGTHSSREILYETVEINAWDDMPRKGCLNIRLVQFLERRGVALDFFLSCAARELSCLEEFAGNNASFFREYHHERRKFIIGHKEHEDVLYQMAAAEVDFDEPYYSSRRRDYLQKKVHTMRQKARYSLDDCWYLRMIPDHLQLLENGEAFVAIGSDFQGSLNEATDVLAFRSPSYFDGDLRKLSLVQYADLEMRAHHQGGEELVGKCKGFFGGLKHGLILSTLGDVSEAERMSGGDFDGDTAWICYHPPLVAMVDDAPPAHRPALAEKNQHELIRVDSENVGLERIKFARHFKGHQRQLGKLAKALDVAIDFFDDFHENSTVRDISGQAFLQVDHPYYICNLQEDTEGKLRKLKEPHWAANIAIEEGSNNTKVYKSFRALGKLWDFVQSKVEASAFVGKNKKPDERILDFVDGQEQDLTSLEDNMKEALREYKEIHKKLEQRLQSSSDDVQQDAWDQLRQHYIDVRHRLFLKRNQSLSEQMIGAAMLYKVCNDSTAFAWNVAHGFLAKIIAPDALVITSNMEREAYAIRK